MIISLLPTFALASEPPLTANHVVINEAYGGGGNSGATLKNDFVELYNPTASDVDLTGWSVQYTSATGTAYNVFAFAAGATIPTKGYYLVQMAAGSGGTAELPSPDAIGTISMSATAFKLALVGNAVAITGMADTDVVDFLGAGSTANEYEGKGTDGVTAGAPAGSNTTSVTRNIPGVDTNVNSADFVSVTPSPTGSGLAIAAPTASAAGGPVKPGDVITFSTTTTGAAISYTVNGGEAVAASTYTVPAGAAERTRYSIVVSAAKAGLTTMTATFSYIVDYAAKVYAKEYASALAAGDVVFLYNPANKALLTTTASGAKLAGVSAEADMFGFMDMPVEAEPLTVETVTVSETPYIRFRNSENKYLLTPAAGNGLSFGSAPDASASGYDAAADYTLWTVSAGNIKSKNAVSSTEAQYLQYYSGAFATYKLGSGGDAFAFSFWKTTDSTPPEVVDISAAKATAPDTAGVAVGGIVTFIDGRNVYVEDDTGAIVLYLNTGTVPSALKVGDMVLGVGKRYTYNGLIELTGINGADSSAFSILSSGNPLPLQTVSLAALKADTANEYLCERVLIKEAVLGAASGSNTPISTRSKNPQTINVYKMPTLDGLAAGDVVNVTGIVSTYNGYQLRVASKTDVQKVQYAQKTAALSDGDRIVIFSDKAVKLLSSTAATANLGGEDVSLNGEYVAVPDGALVLTVSKDAATGNYSFLDKDGKYLTTGATGNSLSLAAAASDYSLWTIESVTGGFKIKSVNAVYSGKAQYIEWFGSKSAFTVAGYNETYAEFYTVNFYALTDELPPISNAPAAGDKVVIYSAKAAGVLGPQDDNATSPSVTSVSAVIPQDGSKAVVDNRGVVFTVEADGDYLLFHNEMYGYLTTGATGNSAFYTKTKDDCCKWTLEVLESGFRLKNATAKYKNTTPQYLEYYSGSYKTYSYSSSTPELYAFDFYATDDVTYQGVVNKPAVSIDAPERVYAGEKIEVTAAVDAMLEYTLDPVVFIPASGAPVEAVATKNTDGTYSISLAAAGVVGSYSLTISGKDTSGKTFSKTVTVTVDDLPYVTEVTPLNGAITGDAKKPVISAVVANAGENYTAEMKVDNTAVASAISGNTVTYTPSADMADGRHVVSVTITRADSASNSRTWFFTVGTPQYQLYFGQLHSHTNTSDGAGTLADGLSYLAGLPESENVDFVAFTDHSNYFDSTSAANPAEAMGDASKMTADSKAKWDAYKAAIDTFNTEHTGSLVAIGGYEMTWSGGPGHMNTFNSAGVVSRNNSTLNDKTSNNGLQAYYAELSKEVNANVIAMFNHPGTTFGTFADFDYWDPVIDSRISLIEVGNGEGAIGSGGYYPSYQYYTTALDMGWHVAPTNNQDNHKGKWGNANDARDVILTDDFSEEGIYKALRDMRVYATEDKNLAITYTLNDQMLGSTIAEVPQQLSFDVTVNDPDASDTIVSVEVVANSDTVVHSWTNAAEIAGGSLSCTLAPDYSYYYIRVLEADEDTAVTAPVWVGKSIMMGISKLDCSTSMPVTQEELTLTAALFNSETTAAAIKSVTWNIGGETFIGNTGTINPNGGKVEATLKYTPASAKVVTASVTVVLTLNGKEFSYAKSMTLDILDSTKLAYLAIDASHYNEYVAGNYKDSMGNFSNLAAEYGVRTMKTTTSQELIAACSNPKVKAIILTAPSRRLMVDGHNTTAVYSAEEIAAISAFSSAGGTIILAGWSDNYENYTEITGNSSVKHMAETQNDILAALGSSLRISDDATYDEVRSAADGVDKWRLYFSSFNSGSFLMDGVEVDPLHPYERAYSEVYSQYGGATIYAVDAAGAPVSVLPDTVTPVVYGHSTTYSADVDKDGLGGTNIPKYEYARNDSRLMVLATEKKEGRGLIVVAGAAFMSNFEVQATLDNNSEKNYANYKICENLANYINPIQITDIADVHKSWYDAGEGTKFTIKGVVTSNASGHDKDTAFFDCIYLQDGTAGINAFPVAGNYAIGDVVRITGTTSSYNGELQIAVSSIKLIEAGTPVEPRSVTAAQAMSSEQLGSLLRVSGTVSKLEYSSDGALEGIYVNDGTGTAYVFIDGYIMSSYTGLNSIKVGDVCTAVGLGSITVDGSGSGNVHRLRVRDRSEISYYTPAANAVVTVPASNNGGSVNVSAAISGTTATVQATQSQLSAIAALAGAGGTVTIDLTGLNVNTAVLPHNLIAALAQAGLAVGLPAANVRLEAGALSLAGSGPITVRAAVLSAGSLTAPQRDALGDKLDSVIMLDVSVSNAAGVLTGFRVGDIKVAADLNGMEKAGVYTVDENGALGNVMAYLNGDVISFYPPHFSLFVIGTFPFDDVAGTNWAYGDVVYAYNNSLFNGISADAFGPDVTMTRQMVWTVLARMDGETPANYAEARDWAMKNGISDGSSPAADVTREQLATLLYRYEQHRGGGFTGSWMFLLPYADTADISGWAYEGMAWCHMNGIVNGVGGNLVSPQGDALRSQVAAMLHRFCCLGK